MTVTPSRVTSTIIKVLYTKNVTIPTLVVNRVIKTVTATCRIPQRQPTPDKRARITPTILHAKALQAPAPTPTFGPSFGPTFGNTNPWGPFGMRKVDTRELNDVPTFLAARRARLAAAGEHAIVKRAPDVPTLTITATNGIVTTVSTVTARTLTATITSTRMATITAIPAPITMMSGVTVLPEKTITLPTSTRMLTKYTIDYAMTTATYSYMYVSFLSPWACIRCAC